MANRVVLLVLLAVTLVFGAAGCGGAAEAEPKASAIKIEFAVEPEAPAVGEGVAVVTLTNSNGQPVDGATVSLHADMDHEGMEPVEAETSTSERGVYRLPVTWTMGGGWLIDVTATLSNGAAKTERFEIFVEAISSGSIVRQHGHADPTPGHESTGEAH